MTKTLVEQFEEDKNKITLGHLIWLSLIGGDKEGKKLDLISYDDVPYGDEKTQKDYVRDLIAGGVFISRRTS